MKGQITTRAALEKDLESIRTIYNQGIEDRIATLETDVKDIIYMKNWFDEHQGRYIIIVAEMEGNIVGWASLNQYSKRTAYNGVADLSIYIQRDYRGKGVGSQLLASIEQMAIANQFYKIVLFTFPHNRMAQTLYRKNGYHEVGIFKNQGKLDGKFIDIMAMEKSFL
ncbi:arsinothricin resistance N-acetyltransferase ArsN1 family A [Alkalihalobacterium alkalinitrilicum]|uniref:arsinothricin resistance N-acetyltransferase ArsN1 family A n=1 Tax=Alkalihalobacterium alkalinitrilicum TaxID=427920 RepID=UPI000995D665|nr:arsinothricin resistance N-acetyltransferase ArsN1 family A [Alkalihalobacterium alkalinitrilicum]